MIGKEFEQERVELEQGRMLIQQLIDAIEELKKDGCKTCLVVDGVVVSSSESKLIVIGIIRDR